jgi:hypothetical protein
MTRLIACTALMAFSYAKDGINVEAITKGDAVDIPADLLEGLIDEGCVKEGSPEFEDKSLDGTPENKADSDPERDALVARAAELELTHHPKLGIPKLQTLIADEEKRLADEAGNKDD